ncbi:transcriptional regulator with XRE-family HTH domain [Clostridium acetobutylicum]|uniref:Predicted transcriptional regulator n=1 Tax=Clostridium acetobutylicum (strain ATCC 824 / DSM 792 / JCM 1419 / IAM 19013 / LMG 5710 / NBRC 13948 / NRRL B-527 / VKM B-1787 / 2291 / W) TaxID=272562 RepID=Q97IT1_CLOAB|nr:MULTISPECIES: helix-turn-helix transcriptional regulator [Clostridium]AAK79526.1 Predicted transcriptional regulator [Clostridium acetobutylicum ATCC 824]ADZ20611.1 transcriptional regulator [Clostridium acetobutylicum EA 2018]AEI31868.1 transcriptional regulator [Clostridium acetobutylicum DSM 1731]AWV81230.1 XRE family transcriptional regulator [Clostridium acetobutylicum]KHD36298.1 XRE family transcriptional regulator [Clostridium acetobutylicum]
MFKHEIGRKLKAARENANLKQSDVAKIIGSTFQKISSFETGRTRVDLETLIRLCEIYNVDADYILSTDKKNSNNLTLKPEESNLIVKFRQLPDSVKEDITDFINMKYNKLTISFLKNK